ncbi:MAG: response regulator, partial [Lachnospiraceae bacterium]|nr:response regulator [Lachnospiraceae bacterium]
GTGLGMAIVNGLLEMMNSKLEIKSVYGEGSEFSFVLEQTIVDATPLGDYSKHARRLSEKKRDQIRISAPDASILVVDDNKMNLTVMRSLLRLCTIVPDLAGSGAEALAKLKDKRYDIVMLDHMMPEMDGIETLNAAKERSLIPDDCIVIALTANAVVGAREEYIREGFDDYLSKPVEIKSLIELLVKYLPEEKVTIQKDTEEKA